MLLLKFQTPRRGSDTDFLSRNLVKPFHQLCNSAFIHGDKGKKKRADMKRIAAERTVFFISYSHGSVSRKTSQHFDMAKTIASFLFKTIQFLRTHFYRASSFKGRGFTRENSSS